MPSPHGRSTNHGEELLWGPGSAVLHRNVLTPAAAEAAMISLLATVPWQQERVWAYGKEHDQPRLVAWFGDAASYTYSGLTLEPVAWTDALDDLRKRCEDLAQAHFNSCLANLYRDGRDRVGWHSDNEKALGGDPIIASLSLGAERRFDFRNKGTREQVKHALPAGSVLVMSNGCQQHWDHQLAKTAKVREPRINLTFRTVLPSL